MSQEHTFKSLPEDAPEWAHILNDNISVAVGHVEDVKDTHTKIADYIEEIKPEIVGVIDSLQKNPMFKMLLGGKK